MHFFNNEKKHASPKSVSKLLFKFLIQSPYAEVGLSLFFFLFRIQEIYPNPKKNPLLHNS